MVEISGGSLGGLGFPPGGDPGGPRRGRWFGDRGRLGGPRATVLLLVALAVIALLLLVTLL